MKYRKSVRLTSLISEEYILLGAEAEGLFRRRRLGVWIRRALVTAACVALLAVTAAAILIPALRQEILPAVDTTESETVNGEEPAVFYLSEKSYVTVEYLVSGKSRGQDETEATVPDGDAVQTEEVNARFGDRLILIHFTCAEGETVTVTPTDHSRLLQAYRFLSSNGYVRWKIWNGEHQAYDNAEAFCSDWDGKPLENIGQSVTLIEDTTLLWQYEIREENNPAYVLPCIEDNFVDFMVTDAEGHVTGGGSIYIGGLDIAAMTEDHTYYADDWVVYNSIYRPCVLGSYRYLSEDGTPVSEAFHDETVAALHGKARGMRDALFEDLSPDSPLFSMREFLPDHYKTFCQQREDGYAWNMTNWLHRSETMPYNLILLESSYSERRFLLYDFDYHEIAETHMEIDNGYGYMVKGYYVTVDGDRVYVDESTPEGFVIVPPQESETH